MNLKAIAEGQMVNTVYFLKKTKIKRSDTIKIEEKRHEATAAISKKIKKGEALIHLIIEVTSLFSADKVVKIKKTDLILTSDYLKRSVMKRIRPGDIVILPIECRKGLEDKATVIQYYRNVVLLETLNHKFKISLTYFDANKLVLHQPIQQSLEDDGLLTDFDPVQ